MVRCKLVLSFDKRPSLVEGLFLSVPTSATMKFFCHEGVNMVSVKSQNQKQPNGYLTPAEAKEKYDAGELTYDDYARIMQAYDPDWKRQF